MTEDDNDEGSATDTEHDIECAAVRGRWGEAQLLWREGDEEVCNCELGARHGGGAAQGMDKLDANSAARAIADRSLKLAEALQRIEALELELQKAQADAEHARGGTPNSNPVRRDGDGH